MCIIRREKPKIAKTKKTIRLLRTFCIRDALGIKKLYLMKLTVNASGKFNRDWSRSTPQKYRTYFHPQTVLFVNKHY